MNPEQNILQLCYNEIIFSKRAYEQIISSPNSAETLIDQRQDSSAFSYYWTFKESSYLKPNAKKGEAFVRSIYVRLLQWKIARLEYHKMLTLKGCPESEREDDKIAANAALSGYAASDRHTKKSQIVEEFWKDASANEYHWNVFRRWIGTPKPADWRHPDLDLWLTLISPLIDSYQWDSAELQRVVNEKFPAAQGYPYDTAEQIGKHYRQVLGRKIKSAQKGRRTLGDSDKPVADTLPGAVLAIEMPIDNIFSRRHPKANNRK